MKKIDPKLKFDIDIPSEDDMEGFDFHTKPGPVSKYKIKIKIVKKHKNKLDGSTGLF